MDLLAAWQEFFKCVSESSSNQARWLRGIRKQMNSLIYRRKLFGGESLDDSANEICLPHVREISSSFARANTAEAASRKLACKTLWRCSGRAGEPGKITLSDMTWNLLFDCPIALAPQQKVGKNKFVPLIPGVDRHADWALDFGDDLCLQRGSYIYDSSAKAYLLPDLSGDHSGTKIGNYVKGLQPAGQPGSLTKYHHVTCCCLPPQPTAAGALGPYPALGPGPWTLDPDALRRAPPAGRLLHAFGLALIKR